MDAPVNSMTMGSSLGDHTCLKKTRRVLIYLMISLYINGRCYDLDDSEYTLVHGKGTSKISTFVVSHSFFVEARLTQTRYRSVDIMFHDKKLTGPLVVDMDGKYGAFSMDTKVLIPAFWTI